MSASDKKKLRKELAAEKLTERQLQEQKEAKKTRTYTIAFVAVIALVLATAIGIMVSRAVTQSGISEKSTIAAVVNGNELNSVEFNYYFSDAVSEYYNLWYTDYQSYTDAYLQVMGLDVTKPLSEQVQDEETGATWADYFAEMALEDAKRDYALCAKAESEGFSLPEEKQTELDNVKKNIETYAEIYGMNTKQYLRSIYGFGSDEKSYLEYLTRTLIADSYYDDHQESLTYEDSDIREFEKDKKNNYNSYTYSSCYLSHTDFLEGGTKGEDGQTVYTDEEKAAARQAAKVAAEALGKAKDAEEMREIAKTIKVNETSQVAVNDFTNQLHTSINGTLSDWLMDEARTEGEIGIIANSSTTTDDAGNQTETVNGYYVAVFQSATDNDVPMSNVRHLLVSFEGGTTDEDTQETVYSDEEKAAAKEAAEGYLKQWKEGEATEESFIELVKEYSDDTSAADGGLFEDIHPGSNYVPTFLNWSIDPDRKVGDTEVIESPYGYHVMYYVSADELTYRDHMITGEMRTADQEAWYDEIMEPVTGELKDTAKLNNDMIISPSTSY